MAKRTEYTEAFILSVENHFINNNITLLELSKRAVDLFGQSMSVDVVKNFSSERDWLFKRSQMKLQNAESRKEQIEQILDQAFVLLTSPEIVQSPSAWSSIANTYFTGLQKTGGSTEKIQKTDLQQVLEGIDLDD